MEKKNKKILKELNSLRKNTLMNTLQIKYIYLGLNFLVAKMPVNKKKLQPIGFLHGGATIALAESVGSSLSIININKNVFNVFNIEISANHIQKVIKGVIFAKAKIIHKGKTIHFIQISIYNEKKEKISYCKMTNIIIPKEKK
ncbi:Thioesterase superfamily protein [Blattabacterium sp. (Blatta orientalis) str. Tarazona]|uniref:PaaI family thioesterase n=1 Tax=Blattabacterium sp. (Blatta orientalis) TaxID=367806 RepID=UPI0002AD8A1C|nr:PaaI family thioesterase [Blattabacterium sp. (Blatta orientalis)]AGD98093.1 Thioesterase superfamily protein [Blattabacterium sp. (Blatta orientalis) str. Tarazona]